jgi:hypothetical protein
MEEDCMESRPSELLTRALEPMIVQIKQLRPSPLFSIAVSMIGFRDRVPQ